MCVHMYVCVRACACVHTAAWLLPVTSSTEREVHCQRSAESLLTAAAAVCDWCVCVCALQPEFPGMLPVEKGEFTTLQRSACPTDYCSVCDC